MKLTFLFPFILSSIFSFGQNEPIPILTMESRILDFANLLNAEQKKSIFTLMQDLESKTGSQIGILTINSLDGMSINEYAREKANMMKLGRPKFKDGILIVFSVNDRLIRIEVGLGLEKIITNEISTLINQYVMAPQFRRFSYAQGFYNGIKSLSERIISNQNLIGQ